MKNLIITAIAAIVLSLTIGCNSQKTATNSDNQRSKQGKKGQRPSTDEVFKMDTNNDGKLSKAEVKGPLERDFEKIDSNSDGFITREELENAPKPERGQRPRRNQ